MEGSGRDLLLTPFQCIKASTLTKCNEVRYNIPIKVLLFISLYNEAQDCFVKV